MSQVQVIELTEYKSVWRAASTLPEEVGQRLWDHYGKQVEVETPSFKNGYQWCLTSLGWVGHIPLTPEFHFVLHPKVQLSNLFRMLEYAYHLKFETSDDLIACQSLAEFYERLAHSLAQRVLERGRKGFYQAYLSRNETLPYVRGQLDVPQMTRRPVQTNLLCYYQEQTADVEENQILAWTLWLIARSGQCTERVLPLVRQAYRVLQGLVTLQPYSADACLDRFYNRLNDDYQPLHALCRFFLEQSGPAHRAGEHAMLPFLVDMARLFELFVAEWLRKHLPPQVQLKVQERVQLGKAGDLHFEIDLVLYDALDQPMCILDTKYKRPVAPASDDISQVVAYAEAKGCREAILVFPVDLAQPLEARVGDIRVRSLTFVLEGDLEQAGAAFISALSFGL